VIDPNGKNATAVTTDAAQTAAPATIAARRAVGNDPEQIRMLTLVPRKTVGAPARARAPSPSPMPEARSHHPVGFPVFPATNAPTEALAAAESATTGWR
jgi:hypothetical protein